MRAYFSTKSYCLAVVVTAYSLAAISQIAVAQELILEEIIVTVQKREQSAQDVPIALTSYNGDMLEMLQINQFEQLGDFVPGLQVQEQSVNNPGFVIRGITSDDGSAAAEPRITIYQDGVSISRSRGSYVSLFDMERVSVSKGPQSTLFGRAALIGAINLVQNKAAPEFSARLKGGIGRFNEQLLEGHVNVPLSDNVAGRLAFFHQSRDGFIDNVSPTDDDLMGKDTQAVRAAFRFEPTDVLSFDFIANYEQNKPPGTSFKSGRFVPQGGDLSPNSSAELNAFGDFENGAGLGVDRNVWGATLLTSWDINDIWQFASVTAYREFESLEVFDPDGFGLPILLFGENAEGEQLSQEFRFSFDSGANWNGFFGVNYFDEDGFQRVPLQFNELIAPEVATGALAARADASQIPPDISEFSPALPGLKPFHQEQFTNFGATEAWDVFADVSWLIGDTLTISSGIRWTFDDKTTAAQNVLLNGPSPLAPLVAALRGVPSTEGALFIGLTPNQEKVAVDNSSDGGSWRLVARWEPTDFIDTFFSYARGRRPDIIATRTGIGDDPFVMVPAEEVDSFELGIKLSLLDKRLNLDSSVYHYQYSNFQEETLNAITGLSEVINAGDAKTTGFEMQLQFAAGENSLLLFNYGYNRSRFADDVDSSGTPTEFAGNQFRLSPDHSAAIAGEFRLPITSGDFILIPSYSWKSEVFFEIDNNPEIAQDSYGLLNLQIGYADRDDRWQVFAFVNNALDEDYIIDGGNTGGQFGVPTFIPGAPRLFGINATYKWN